MGRLFGTDGIRGVVGDDLTFALAREVGRALVQVLSKRAVRKSFILIGMDTRLSSFTLADSVLLGITDAGGDVVNIDVCPTPAVAYLVKKHNFDAGVMISASHNPWEYNGIKIFGSDGFKLSDDLENQIEEIILCNDIPYYFAKERGRIKELRNGLNEYIDYLIKSSDHLFDGIKIAIDCANGSAYTTAKTVFEGLGAECFMLADDPDGMNINRDCGSTHLNALRDLVINNKLNLGIAFDGDADRCLAIDENGREVDGDHILAILGARMKSEGRLRENAIVGTVMTNLGLVRFCEENGIDFTRARVGDRYVLEELNNKGLSLGGEQSGHIIIRDLATTGDGQLTAVALLSCIKESGKSLGALADIMKKYPQYMINLEADSADKENFKNDSQIKEIIKESEIEIAEHGRIIIRPSGTEHLIRIMTEGDDPVLAEKICTNLSEKIKKRLNVLK